MGSKICVLTIVAHAAAVVHHLDDDIGAGLRRVGTEVRERSPGPICRTLVRHPDNAGRSPVASTALRIRFMTSCWIWLASASIGGRSGCSWSESSTERGHRGAQQLADIAHQRRAVHGLDDELALARIGEQLASEIGGALAGADDVLEHALDLRVGRDHLEHQAGVAEDACQQVIEIVGHAAGQ